MPLSSTGYTTTRYEDWVKYYKEQLSSRLSFTPTFDSQDPMTHIVNIWATNTAAFDEDLFAIYSSRNIYYAEGNSLDVEVRKMNIVRQSSSPTSGYVAFVGSSGAIVTTGVLVSNSLTNDVFQTTEEVEVSLNGCVEVTYAIANVGVGITYSVIINDIEYSYTSTVANMGVIIRNIADLINAEGDVSAEMIFAPTAYLRIYVNDYQKDTITITNTTELTLNNIAMIVAVECTEDGAVLASANSIDTIDTPVSGITGVFAPIDLGTGRLRETDEELRIRALTTIYNVGSGTPESIRSAVLNVDGVTSCIVLHNPSSIVDADGLQPHSVHVIVVAPDDTITNNSIAAAIASKLPLGTYTNGSTEVVYDYTDDSETIRFSRPDVIHVAVRVTYTENPEETLVTGFSDIVKDAIVAYGNGLGTGADVIPKRIMGKIYDAVDGFEDLVVEVQSITNSGDTPNPLSWSESKLSVGEDFSANFASVDITIVEA